jgi:hypothetical protein
MSSAGIGDLAHQTAMIGMPAVPGQGIVAQAAGEQTIGIVAAMERNVDAFGRSAHQAGITDADRLHWCSPPDDSRWISRAAGRPLDE